MVVMVRLITKVKVRTGHWKMLKVTEFEISFSRPGEVMEIWFCQML